MADQESYPQRANPVFEAEMALRTASQEAAFFLPSLRPGMRVLDLGCGPGSITLGLAEAVAPGEVVGVDLQPEQVEQARALDAARGVINARFEVAEVYRLPFPDGAFDAAFAHAVLMHLREPVRALAELRRVLRPAALLGFATVIGADVSTRPRRRCLRNGTHLWYGSVSATAAIPSWAVITAGSCSMPGLRGQRRAYLCGMREHRRKPIVVPPSSRPNCRALLRRRWRSVGWIRQP